MGGSFQFAANEQSIVERLLRSEMHFRAVGLVDETIRAFQEPFTVMSISPGRGRRRSYRQLYDGAAEEISLRSTLLRRALPKVGRVHTNSLGRVICPVWIRIQLRSARRRKGASQYPSGTFDPSERRTIDLDQRSFANSGLDSPIRG